MAVEGAAIAPSGVEPSACTICLDSEGLVANMEFPCGCRGEFHSTCVEKWHLERADVCPICRTCWCCEKTAQPLPAEQAATEGRLPAPEAYVETRRRERRRRGAQQQEESITAVTGATRSCAACMLCFCIIWPILLMALRAGRFPI